MLKTLGLASAIFIQSISVCFAQPGTERPPAIESRVMTLLQAEVETPRPPIVCQTAASKCDYALIYHALAQLYVGADRAGQDQANTELANAVQRLETAIGPAIADDVDERSAGDKATPFHFQRAQMLYRMLRLFGRDGTRAPQTIKPDVEQGILALFQRWGLSHCRLSDADPAATWRIWGSENHHAQLVASCWAAADLLRRSPTLANTRYADGSGADQQYRRWVSFIKEYIRQRGRFGFLESDSPTYAAYTLETFYNYVDFADDPDQARLARSLLDLWWAQWAAEQVGGVVGASKSRVYPDALDAGSPLRPVAWSYFGLGRRPVHNPSAAAALTSDYTPPSVVEANASGGPASAGYDVVTTAPGRLARPKAGGSEWYTVDPQLPAVVRRTHVAPGFAMGAAMLPRYPARLWAGSSSQNRWNGVVLAGEGSPRIALVALPAAGASTFNALQAVQDCGAQVVQALPPPFSVNVGQVQVRFTGDLKPVEADGWIFVESSAYVAVKIVRGGYDWDAAEPGRVKLRDRSSPVVLQAATKSDFKDLAAFQDAVSKAPLSAAPDGVAYRGVGDCRPLRLFEGGVRLPEIGGTPVDLTPADSVRSPFVSVTRDTGAGRICDRRTCSDLRF